MDFEFHGGKELEEALSDLKLSARKSIARRVMKKALVHFLDAVQALAPRGLKGTLAMSYGIGTRLNQRQSRGVRKSGQDDVFAYAGTNDPAGTQQEFGNENHGPQPHARPAWEQTKLKTLQIIQAEMSVEVEKTIARARRKAEREAAKSK
jgi:hypothetical protein